jgi:phospholipase C
MKRLALLAALALAASACSSSSDDSAGGSPSTSDDGGDAGGGGGDDASDAPTSCDPTPVPDDPTLTQRQACTFAAGAKVADTLGLGDADRSKIPLKHVIVLMKENRSFDHIFGNLAKAGQPDVEVAADDWSNADSNGATVTRFHATSTCVKPDPGHQWDDMHAESNGGKMDGFVTNAAKTTSTDGHFVMGYYDEHDLPFYYFLANTFAIADHYFPSVLSGTWPNRDYLYCGSSDGVKATGGGFPQIPTIFDSLDTAGVTWEAYSDGAPLELSLGWLPGHAGTGKMADFFGAITNGTLPQVSFVDGTSSGTTEQDEHPPGDVQLGEAWTKSIYDAVVASSYWKDTAILLTYDEAGGYADHVPPPTNGCVAAPSESAFTELGVRVPLIVISPWARRHYVSHAVHEHTSMLRLIEAIFDVPALTARDANSDALLDMFDFGCGKTDVPAAPDPGTGGCTPADAGTD